MKKALVQAFKQDLGHPRESEVKHQKRKEVIQPPIPVRVIGEPGVFRFAQITSSSVCKIKAIQA